MMVHLDRGAAATTSARSSGPVAPSGVTVLGAIIATISCASMMIGSIGSRPSIDLHTAATV
jgi:hypothetical protein